MVSNLITILFVPIVFYYFHCETSEYVPFGVIVCTCLPRDFRVEYTKVEKLIPKIIIKNSFKAVYLTEGIYPHLSNYAGCTETLITT